MMNVQKISDKTAIGLSLLCVIHCLILPILLMIVPTFAGIAFLKDETFHLWMLFAVIPISCLALLMGYRHHKSRQTLLIGFIGLSIIAATAYLGHDLLGRVGEVVLTVLGSCTIALSHLRNYRMRNQHKL